MPSKTIRQKDGFQGQRSVVLPPMAIDASESDLLVKSLYITDIGYYPNAANHYRERLSPINQYILIYCVDGSGFYEVGGKRHQVEGNQYFVLPAGEPHCYGSSPTHPWTIYWVHFAGAHADIYAQGAMLPQAVRPGVTSRISERNNIFEEILATLQQGFDCERLRYASSLLHHYLASMRYLAQYRHAIATYPSNSDVAQAVIRYMSENIEHRLTAKQLAEYTGYSTGHLSAIFKSQTGISPTAYFNQLKMNQAAKLIVSTNMKINQICHKVGIDDCYYFSRLFTKTMGMSPQQYRNTNANKNQGL
ncbi:MAG: AraC family transcriptional regulator [Muribaculaceae bacterium]